jgi:TonB family protein
VGDGGNARQGHRCAQAPAAANSHATGAASDSGAPAGPKAATIGGMYAWKPLAPLVAALALPALLLIGCAGANRPLQFIGGTDLVYPATARQQGIEGTVTVRYDVTVDGAVENVAIESATPPGVFDAAALAAVRTWRFNPPMRGGEPVAAPGQVSTLRFQLGDTSRYSRTGMGP